MTAGATKPKPESFRSAGKAAATSTQVRASGFGSYESLVAQRCGATSTLLAAFDHDTNLGTIFAVGRATGPTTAIKRYGSFQASFGAKVHFLLTGAYGPQRVGG